MSVAGGLLAVVRFYRRAISPVIPPRCRFEPSCSAYAVEAIEVHGAGRGSWLAVRRLLKCAPWHPGGVDLVPPARPGTSGPAHPSGPAAPAASPADAQHGPDRVTTAVPAEGTRPAPRRSAQQEARVA